MKKSRLKKSHSKSKLSWIIAGLAFFLAGSVYLAIASGTGPLSFFTKTPDINKVDCKGDDDCIEANAIAKKQGLKGTQYDKAVQQVTQTLKKDNVYVEKMTVKERNKPEAEDLAEDVPATQQVVISQPATPCSAKEQLVTTSTGNQCIPKNGDSTSCGVYAYAQNNKCYKIGDEVSGGYKVCDWTIGGRPGVTWAFLSTNCPTKTTVKSGIPTNADDCSTSKEFPGWWSENEKTCVQVGQQVSNSPLIVCGAGQRTDKPQYNYPTISTPEVCSSYTAPPVIPPAPVALSNEELERRQEDCRSSLKKYDIASGACIDLVKCTPVPLTTGAKSYTTCGSDGKIELKLCNNPAGFDANGLCPVTPPVAAPITPNAPSEEFRCGEGGGTWKNGACLSPGSLEPRKVDKATECLATEKTQVRRGLPEDGGGIYCVPLEVPSVQPPPVKTPVTPTVPTNSFVQNPNGKLDQLVKSQGECKLTGSAYDSEFNLWRCPSADGSVKPPTVFNEAGFSVQSPASNPEKCNLFTGACDEGTVCSNRLFGGYCKPIATSSTPTNTISNPNAPNIITNKNGIVGAYANDPGECKYGNGATQATNGKYICPTDTNANPTLDSIPIPAQPVTPPQEPDKSVWSQITEFFTKSNQQLTTPQETNTEEVTVKPPLWSRVMEYFSNLFPINNATSPQGFLDPQSCETRYQADCIEDADGMWYPTFSK